MRAPQAAREGPSAHTMGAREGVGAEGSARSGRARAGSPPAPALALAMRWRNDRRLPGRTRAIFDLTQGGGGLSGGSLGMSGCKEAGEKPPLIAPDMWISVSGSV